jgi:hypothetical protein
MVHAQPHGLRPFVGRTEGDDASKTAPQQLEFRITVAQMAGWASPLIRGLGGVMTRAANYYGWSPGAWDEECTITLEALAICMSSDGRLS